MPAPNNAMMADGGGGNSPKSPYVPSYVNYKYYQQQSAAQQRLVAQQAEAARRAQLLAAARARAQAQAAAQQAAQAQRDRWAKLAQQNTGWNAMNMEPTAPNWQSPVANQQQPSLQNTLSMEPTVPPITYQHHNPFGGAADVYGSFGANNTPAPQEPLKFSIAYGPARLPFSSNVPPAAASWEVYQQQQNPAPMDNKVFLPFVNTPPKQFNPSANYFSDYWNNMMTRVDAYGNHVPLGPINEYWEFTDVPDTGYGGYGGWGSGGGYEAEDSAPFYRGDYTQNKSRWNETLLTWGLRQE